MGSSGAAFAFTVDLAYAADIELNGEPFPECLAWPVRSFQAGLRPYSVSTTPVVSQGQYGLVLGYTGGFTR